MGGSRLFLAPLQSYGCCKLESQAMYRLKELSEASVHQTVLCQVDLALPEYLHLNSSFKIMCTDQFHIIIIIFFATTQHSFDFYGPFVELSTSSEAVHFMIPSHLLTGILMKHNGR